MKPKYLNRELASEIRKRYEHLHKLEEPDIKDRCKQMVKRDIERNSQVHSYRMENPNIIIPFSVPRNKNKKTIRQGIKNIGNAFEWGTENFDPDNFDEYFIRELAVRITPELYDTPIATYRDRNVVISGASVTPPYPTKLVNYEIPKFVDSLKEQFQCHNLVNNVESAIYAHLHLAKIHPFLDGNGRTARVLQNIILHYNDIPPPVIEAGERMTYYKILDKAVLSMDEMKAAGKNGSITEEESIFYDFIGGKINSSLDKIVMRCS